MTTFFSKQELQCKCGCGLANFHPGVLDELVKLRTQFDKPMNLSSACRCLLHNTSVSKMAPRSSLHIGNYEGNPGQEGSMAFDVLVNGIDKGELFALAWANGWSIGWNKSFLHLDKRVLIGMPQLTFEY
jgi:hypothetical protein